MIFLTGFIIERLKDEEMAMKGYFGFEIMHQDLSSDKHHHHEKRVLYCKSEDERDRWVSNLQHAAHVVPIEDDYVIGKELGRGRFSIVCECVHKMSGVHCAVKIIDKATIEPEEKGLLRTEIAVLKLVNHPNIIRMEGLYESKGHIYIVMEMLKGGELFERIVGRPRFTEIEAAKLIRPLLESVAYLHDLGEHLFVWCLLCFTVGLLGVFIHLTLNLTSFFFPLFPSPGPFFLSQALCTAT